jgi:predicted transcriptional regulator
MDILQAVQEDGSAKPTRVLQKANLSHDRLTRYMGELVQKNLVKENLVEGGVRYYTMTEQGIKFLQELRRAENFVSGFGLEF